MSKLAEEELRRFNDRTGTQRASKASRRHDDTNGSLQSCP
jgi:hypothetical protein